MKLETAHNIYFVGIGGVGMSALAKYFVANGKNVAGYDKTPTEITQRLQEEGVEIHFDDNVDNINSNFLDPKNTWVVYTPAIPKTHSELQFFKSEGFTILKRAELLGNITQDSFCFGVAGTHGKTTTTAILGHIMSYVKATAFLGGVSENYQSNLILGEDKITVVEADEFDRSFLNLSPNIACVTSTDADHLDIYGEKGELLESFKDFANKVSDHILVAKGVDLEGLTYAIGTEADYQVVNLKVKNGHYQFDVITPSKIIKNLVFNLPGRHNVMNATAAIAMADLYEISSEVIREKLASFNGVKRRFTYKIKREDLVLIDDYAHHPTEINAIERSVKEMYPEDKAMVVFQPHLFSRTRDFMNNFAEALSKFDEVLLLDIYPAREKPIEGVTSSILLDKITCRDKKMTTPNEVLNDIKSRKSRVVAMLGAGDIGVLIDKVKNKL